jgi:hypothetical protein
MKLTIATCLFPTSAGIESNPEHILALVDVVGKTCRMRPPRADGDLKAMAISYSVG